MAQVADNVVSSKPKVSGAVWIAPIGTALPTSASTELDAAFKSLGYIDSTGIVETIENEKRELKAFGGDTVHIVNTGQTVKYKFKPMEYTKLVHELEYGASNVSGTETAIAIEINNKSQANMSYVFELVLSDGRIERIVVPVGSVDSLGERGYANDSSMGNEITISCLPDDNGNKAYKYIAKVG